MAENNADILIRVAASFEGAKNLSKELTNLKELLTASGESGTKAYESLFAISKQVSHEIGNVGKAISRAKTPDALKNIENSLKGINALAKATVKSIQSISEIFSGAGTSSTPKSLQRDIAIFRGTEGSDKLSGDIDAKNRAYKEQYSLGLTMFKDQSNFTKGQIKAEEIELRKAYKEQYSLGLAMFKDQSNLIKGQIGAKAEELKNAYKNQYSEGLARFKEQSTTTKGQIKAEEIELRSRYKEQYSLGLARFKDISAATKGQIRASVEESKRNWKVMGDLQTEAIKFDRQRTAAIGESDKALGKLFNIRTYQTEKGYGILELEEKLSKLKTFRAGLDKVSPRIFVKRFETEDKKIEDAGKFMKDYTKGVDNDIRTTERSLAGYKRGFAAMTDSVVMNVKNLIKWQAQWYGAKFFLFTPIEMAGRGIQNFLEWEQAMKNVQAVSNITKKELVELSKVTREIGETTPISAKEAAKAMLEFGQAGLSTNAIVEAMPIAAKMVVATQEDMKTAVSALTTAYYAWNLQASDFPRVGAQMAAAMAESKLKVGDLSTIFNYLATQANQAGLSIKDTLTLVTLASRAGVKASTIGTGLSQAMISFIRMPQRLKGILGEAGLNWKEFTVPEHNFLDVLKKLASTSEITLQKIFEGVEVRAGRSLNAILQQIVSGFDEVYKKIGDPEALNRMFKISMEGLQNRFTLLKNQISNLAIVLGEDLVAPLVVITEVIEKLTNKTSALKGVIVTIAEVIGGIFLISLLKKIAAIKSVNAILGGFKDALTSVTGLLAFLASKTFIISAMVVFGIKLGKFLFKAETGGFIEEDIESFNEHVKELVKKGGEAAVKELSDLYSSVETGYGAGIEETEEVKKRKLAIITEGLANVSGFAYEIAGWQPYKTGDREVKKKGKIADYTAAWADINKALSNVTRTSKDIEKDRLSILEEAYKTDKINFYDYQNEKIKITKEANAKEESSIKFTLIKNRIAYWEAADLIKKDKSKEEDVRKKELDRVKKDYENNEEALNNRLKELGYENLDTDRKIVTEKYTYRKNIAISWYQFLYDLEQSKLQQIFNMEEKKADESDKLKAFQYEKKKITSSDYYEYEIKQAELRHNRALDFEKKSYLAFAELQRQKALVTIDPETMDKISQDSEKRYVEYNSKIEGLAVEHFNIMQEIGRKWVDNIQKIYEQGKAAGVINKVFTDIVDNYKNTAQQIYDTTNNIIMGMENSFADFFDYTSEGFMNWGNLIKGILNDVYKEILRTFLMKQIVGGVVGAASFLPIFGGTTGVDYETGLSYSVGAGGKTKLMGAGGRVSLNKSVIVGDKGMELFTPDSSGSITPNNQLGFGQPIVNVAINVENQTGQQVNMETKGIRFDTDKIVVNAVLKNIGQYGELYHVLGARR